MAIYSPFRAPAIFLIEAFFEQLWGFKPNFIRPFIHQKGAVRSLFWCGKNMLKYEGTLEKWSPLRTHLSAMTVSALNACPYTVFGHALAVELLYLKQTGRLFPLTEGDLVQLCGRSEEEIMSALEQALIEADLSSEILGLYRLVELRRSPEMAATEQDRDWVHLNRMFATLNTSAVKSRVSQDQAHDSINKDRGMRDRYFTQRKTERLQPAFANQSDTVVLNPADMTDWAEVSNLN
ncbi:MAG: hypothetical protein AAFO84_05735 [Cyanobacteria bacterium J06598_1]